MLRLDFPDQGPIVSYTRDIGIGGLYLENHHGLTTGEIVQVSLSTPTTWEPVVITAKTVWTSDSTGDDPAGVGLQFLDLSEDQIMALSAFVRTLDFED